MRISKLPKQMNNPDEAPLYPNSPDYTNSETALKVRPFKTGAETDFFPSLFRRAQLPPLPGSRFSA